MRRIGVLIGGDENDPVWRTYVPVLTRALANLGWTDGRNVRMDLRWGGGDTNRIRALPHELKVVPIIAPVHGDAEIETAIIALEREPGGGLVVMPGTFMFAHRAPIILATLRNNVPAVYPQSRYARDGGLFSYGPDQRDILRRAATYVDRILRGEKPGDLPVQLPTKFEVVLNLKTAKALGLAIPPSILLRADEVIE
jgi:putative ABC transport system substrate-binding protein